MALKLTSSQAYVSVQIAAKAIAAITALTIAWQTGPATLGRYTLALLTGSLGAVLLDSGCGKTVLRLSSMRVTHQEIFFTIRRRYILLRAAIVPAAAFFLLSAHGGTLWGLTAFLPSVLAWNGIYDAELLGRGLGGWAAAANLLSNTTTLAVTWVAIGLSHRNVNAAVLVAAYLSGAAVARVVYVRTLTRENQRVENPPESVRSTTATEASREVQFSFVAVVVMVVGFLYYRADVMIVGVLAGPAALGVFALAYRIIEIPLNVLQLLALVHQRAVSAATGNDSKTKVRSLVVLGGLGAVFAASVVLLGPWFIGVTVGRAYAESGPLMVKLAYGIIGQALSLGATIYILRSTHEASPTALLANVATLVMMLVAVPTGWDVARLTGVAVAEAACELACGAILCTVVFRSRSSRARYVSLGVAFVGVLGLVTTVARGNFMREIAATILLVLISVGTAWAHREVRETVAAW